MSRLHYLTPCPEHLYKYCRRDIYEEHIRRGSFRLGTLHDFRVAYNEQGAEYGDQYEGNPTLLKKGPFETAGQSVGEHGGAVFDIFVNAYIFSAAVEYSKHHHKTWFERDGCGYDVCVVLKAKEFLEQLARQVRSKSGQVGIVAAKPIYRSGVIDLAKEPLRDADQFLIKHPRFAWESEYRLVCSDPTLPPNSIKPLFVNSFRLASCIDHVLEYDE